MNPAISLAMFASGHISLFRALLHVIFQLSGAIIAVLLFYGVAPGEKDRIGDTFPHLHPGLAAWQGFFIEFIQGVLLSVAWLSSTTATTASSSGKEGDGATKRPAGSGTAGGSRAAVVVGFALLANSLWANALTGASVNPARCVAPIIFFRTFDATLWVYIAGPIIGCVAGAVLYQQLFVTLPQSGSVLVLGGGLTTSDSSSSGGSECGGVTQIRSVEGKRDDDVTSFGNGDDVTADTGMYVASINNHHSHVIHDQHQQRLVHKHRFMHHRFSALPTTNHQHFVQITPATSQHLHHHHHQPQLIAHQSQQQLVTALQQPLVPTTTAAGSVHRTMTPMRLNMSMPTGTMLGPPPTPQSSSTTSRRIVVRGEVNAVAGGAENEQLIGNSDL